MKCEKEATRAILVGTVVQSAVLGGINSVILVQSCKDRLHGGVRKRNSSTRALQSASYLLYPSRSLRVSMVHGTQHSTAFPSNMGVVRQVAVEQQLQPTWNKWNT